MENSVFVYQQYKMDPNWIELVNWEVKDKTKLAFKLYTDKGKIQFLPKSVVNICKVNIQKKSYERIFCKSWFLNKMVV